jgi:hypothetical protein
MVTIDDAHLWSGKMDASLISAFRFQNFRFTQKTAPLPSLHCLRSFAE